MKRFILFLLMIIPVLSMAQSWHCVDHAKDYSWWVYVYDDIQKPKSKYSTIKVWVKLRFDTPSAQAEFRTRSTTSRQLHEIYPDFKSYRILQVTDYDRDDKIIGVDNAAGSKFYIVPGTIAESIVMKVREILEEDN